jgi:UDP-N-acetyl-D-glucosamine dehydrogenase
MNVTIVGQGYVGLPLAMAATKAGYRVYGLDSNESRIEQLKKGYSFIADLNQLELEEALNSNLYIPTLDKHVISDSDVILICVPTPLNYERKPDLTLLLNASKTVGKYVSANSLVIIESTIEPGTCRNVVLPILTQESGLSADEFYLAYSPERIDPSNDRWTVTNTPKIVSGYTKISAQKTLDFYSKFIDTLVECESMEVAETAKLLENSFRLINISFINDIAIFCGKLGIDVNQVISAAATKPYGFMPFYPSIGVGGHCIPVDPLYLANKAREIGAPTRFIDLADQINQEMPGYFVSRAEEKIGGLKGKKVLVIGVSYKPNVADVRETPVEALVLGLKDKGAEVFWHDDLVTEWNGEKSVALSDKYDLAILATPHDYLDLTKLGDVPILNTRGSI